MTTPKAQMSTAVLSRPAGDMMSSGAAYCREPAMEVLVSEGPMWCRMPGLGPGECGGGVP